jgi:hypothetical protein
VRQGRAPSLRPARRRSPPRQLGRAPPQQAAPAHVLPSHPSHPPPTAHPHKHRKVPTRYATSKGHLAGEHATVADSYDLWKMAAGMDRRRLGEALVAAAKTDPMMMSALTQLVVQGAVMNAAEGKGSTRYAGMVGREMGVIGSVDKHLDTTFHVGEGEAPEGPMTEWGADDVRRDTMPTRGYGDRVVRAP